MMSQETVEAGAPKRTLTPSMEDYLEAIYELSGEKRNVRVKDIAKRLDVKMPTVTSMLKTLSKEGLIDYEKYEYLELTERGTRIGKDVHRRHRILRDFLMGYLKVDEKTAEEDACKLEHAISDSALAGLVDFMEFLQICPRAGSSLLEHFEEYTAQGHDQKKCVERFKAFADRLVAESPTPKRAEGNTHRPGARRIDSQAIRLL